MNVALDDVNVAMTVGPHDGALRIISGREPT